MTIRFRYTRDNHHTVLSVDPGTFDIRLTFEVLGIGSTTHMRVCLTSQVQSTSDLSSIWSGQDCIRFRYTRGKLHLVPPVVTGTFELRFSAEVIQ